MKGFPDYNTDRLSCTNKKNIFEPCHGEISKHQG